MPKFNPDSQPNINDLIIEEPQKEQEPTDVSFDPIDIFTNTDWYTLENLAKRGDGHGEDRDIIMPNSALAIIDKERLNMDDSMENKILEGLKKYTEKGGGLQSMAWASYISPDFLKISDEDLKKVVENGNKEMAEDKERNSWRHFIEPVAWLTLIGQRPELSQEDFENIEKCLISQDSGAYLIEVGAAMSIIYPDYPLRFSQEKTDKIKAFLKECVGGRWGGGEWYMFSAMAKIVADKCREVNARKPKEGLAQETPSMPEQKEF
ncbi:MAG: hypothetical protein A2360_04910 [Candidatus Staskawiczbacteria bacterium RIFOXYB1_FULL_32_11]|uniref:Uncharacterized protein n=1 Tax=Candidatus Staskawiczbacteria bacterium RIFOXYD1_FULL_32_13 TaxID=1802234 RepID=A0A1G2JMX7_9BACT|nr:MAG: hypothetical protein UR22_C0001G0011 [Parcubacteria group bacterium GW2011_GWC2_32_10]OGZ79756.1 MAG: hypothetical protein A2360_04910 [Candidatus Staskawiczbacteria bacterium RIFOXYB1_FULL_32_11]OGZ81024.1 MAG: hypothetical protein A2256_04205 [Candidatus Staskawiczbacteria bacterium RIFOXYA2_FULL_32_7]OGZ87650.1 MAG: hypothetical protein A2561_03055 [Candidatus Staskawiczbacteria bacterium RIFOXYD1_FULL_32_13]